MPANSNYVMTMKSTVFVTFVVTEYLGGVISQPPTNVVSRACRQSM